MKKINLILLFSIFFITINGCKKDEPEQEQEEQLSEYHVIKNCKIELPAGTNTSAIGTATILTAGDSKTIDLGQTNRSTNYTQSGNEYSTEVKVGKETVNIGTILNQNDEPLAYCVYVPNTANDVLFNATETAIAIVFMHPFLSSYNILTANTIKTKIQQTQHFSALRNEVLDRTRTGTLNLNGQDFDPTTFSNYLIVVKELIDQTYDNASVNQDGIQVVDITQDNQYVRFKIKNYRKRWLKVIPTLFTNGNTSITNFHNNVLNFDYPFGYVGSIDIDLWHQFITNPDLTSIYNTSIEFVVEKNNADQLYLDIYGNGLDQYGHIPQPLLDDHLDVVAISTFEDFILPIFEMSTGISDLQNYFKKQNKILVGRPNNDPYNKFLERLINYLDNHPSYKVDYKALVDDNKTFLSLKLSIKEIMNFIVSDIQNNPKNFYEILKEEFGENVIKQNSVLFRKVINTFNLINKSLSFLSAGANALTSVNTVLYSDWHNQKRIDLTYDNSPIVQTDPVITNLTANSVTLSGNIVNDNGSAVIESGFCWSDDPLQPPSISGDHITNTAQSGLFTNDITNLSPNTQYSARAYARNSNGVGYGDIVTFQTLQPLPTLSSTVITNFTATSATATCIISDDGGSPITVSGVCYSTSPNPTTADSHTTDGITSVGTFTSNITGLQPGTTYYARAYATNANGTGYDPNVVMFVTNNANIYNGDVTLSTQADVDAFGANGYTEIDGYLFIGDYSNSTNISDLSSLTTLNSINGNFWIMNTNITNLNGLDNLNSIQDNFYISYNNNLIDISQLLNLSSLNGGLVISNNNSLTSLNGLNNISSIGGALVIEYTPIIELDVFQNLVSIGSLNINNTNITSLYGLHNINNISNDISISSNPNLSSFNAFSNISHINGNLTFGGNNISNVNSFSNLISIGGALSFNENSLTDISGFSNLQSIGGDLTLGSRYSPHNNQSLNNVSFNNLVSVNDIRIEKLDNVTAINFPSLQNCEDLTIYANHTLSTINFGSLSTVDGDLWLSNSGLVLDNFNSLTTVNGDIWLGERSNHPYNPYGSQNDLTNLDGLSNLNSVGGQFVIRGNSLLTNLCGIQNLVNSGFTNIGISNNAYNPTVTDIANGNCSQ